MKHNPRARAIAPLAGAALAVLGLASVRVEAQVPAPATGPAPAMSQRAGHAGPLRRAWRHTSENLHANVVGNPALFAVPPLGASVYGTYGVHRARADVHHFMLYRSDFVAGTTALSPSGYSRMSRLEAGLPQWLGPVVVEATPEAPALADARRATVAAMLQRSCPTLIADRVLVGGSPYPGLLGADAANNFDNLINRDQRAARTFSTTPAPGASLAGSR